MVPIPMRSASNSLAARVIDLVLNRRALSRQDGALHGAGVAAPAVAPSRMAASMAAVDMSPA